MAEIQLGRVQGAGMFTTTAASATSIALSTIKPTTIKPMVGDGMVFPNGDFRSVTAISGTNVTLGAVLFTIKGANGTNGSPGSPGTSVSSISSSGTSFNFYMSDGGSKTVPLPTTGLQEASTADLSNIKLGAQTVKTLTFNLNNGVLDITTTV